MSSRRSFVLTVMLLGMAVSGCNLLHNLKPHRLHRLNQGPKPYQDSTHFSVPDPLDGRLVPAAKS